MCQIDKENEQKLNQIRIKQSKVSITWHFTL